MELVAAPQRLGHQCPRVDPSERLEGRVERGRELVADPDEALVHFLVVHAEDERLTEALHQKVKGAVPVCTVFDHEHGQGRGDRTGPTGHCRVILGRAEHDLAGAQLRLGLLFRCRELLEESGSDQPASEEVGEVVPSGGRRRVQDQVRSKARHDLAGGLDPDQPGLAREHAPDRLAVRVSRIQPMFRPQLRLRAR